MGFPDIAFTPFALAIYVVLFVFTYYFIKNRNILPGPIGLPYLGLYPFLNTDNYHLKLHEYKKQYGDLFSFTYAGKLFINLGSAKAMRELHCEKSDIFEGRFADFSIEACLLGQGITMLNGESWKILRKFFNYRIRKYGLNTGLENFEKSSLSDPQSDIVEELKSLGGKPVNIVDILVQKCTFEIRKVLFGEKGISDEEYQQICIIYKEVVLSRLDINTLLMGIPARLLIAMDSKYRNSVKQHDVLIYLLRLCLKKIEISLNEDQPCCIIEDYFKEKNEKLRKKDPTSKLYTDDTLIDTALQFMGDAMMGSSIIIAGFLNALLKYPEEEEKIYNELMEVVGPNRQPAIEDKCKLPYVNAFMNEVLREYTFLHLQPSLECKRETTCRGYRIPKGSITVPNYFSAHHDSETFEDPDVFQPSRYLPAPGKTIPELPLIFGVGRRACTGQPYVMNQSFLFLATIVKNFKIISSNNPLNKSTDFLATGKLELILHSRCDF